MSRYFELQPPLPGGAGVGAPVPRDGAPQQHLIPPRRALQGPGGGAGGVALQPGGGSDHAKGGCRHLAQIQPPQTGIVKQLYHSSPASFSSIVLKV